MNATVLPFRRPSKPAVFRFPPEGSAAWLRWNLERVFPWAILSAERSDLDQRENAARTARLWADLVAGGYSPIAATGTYDGVREASFIVLGMPEGEALSLARSYAQESIVVPAGLRYCDTLKLVPSRGWSWQQQARFLPEDNFTVVRLDSGEVLEFSMLLDF